MGSIGACGALDYFDVESQTRLNNFLVNLHCICGRLSVEFEGRRRIRVLIYGASSLGRLVAMYLRQVGNVDVLGLMDNALTQHRAWVDIGVFNPPEPSVRHPADWAGTDVDAVICTTHPRHYGDIYRTLRQIDLVSKIYFVDR
jgi:hypothetical protein